MPPRPDVSAELVDQAALDACDVWSALQAFGSDPSYLTHMIEAANAIDARREAQAAREAEAPTVLEETTLSA